MKLYIVRHGEVNHNLLKTYSNENEDLNNTGIMQAEKLKNKMMNLDYDIIISSPLVRAIHTANIINNNNKDIVIDDRLKERNSGSLNGKSLQTTNRFEYWNYYSKIQYGTSENIQTFFKRVYSFLDDLKFKKYNSVLIVCHSGVSKAIYSYFNGINNEDFLNKGLDNCEIKEYNLF